MSMNLHRGHIKSPAWKKNCMKNVIKSTIVKSSDDWILMNCWWKIHLRRTNEILKKWQLLPIRFWEGASQNSKNCFQFQFYMYWRNNIVFFGKQNWRKNIPSYAYIYIAVSIYIKLIIAKNCCGKGTSQRLSLLQFM